MASDVQSLLAFLDEQKKKQAKYFPTVKCGEVLSFMATTSLAGTYAAVSVNPVLSLEPTAGGKELHVHLRGSLPRAVTRGECVTVHITRVEQYQGYQIKTRPLAAAGGESALHVETAPGELLIKGTQIFTVHHSPYTMKFFEQIPYEEVQQIIGGVKCALVGVGEQANISPRFIFHYETKLDRLILYHGDGLALKTYMNLKSNRQVTRIIVDLDEFRGYAVKGTVEEWAPHQNPEAYDRICQGFAAGNWGKPSRVFRFVADTWSRIEPQHATGRFGVARTG